LLSLHLLGLAELKVDTGRGGTVALIQPFGSAGNLNIHSPTLRDKGLCRRVQTRKRAELRRNRRSRR
jgi:hypothetical protein